VTVADALRAVTAYIEDHSNEMGWSGREFPSGEQRSVKTAAFCRDCARSPSARQCLDDEARPPRGI